MTGYMDYILHQARYIPEYKMIDLLQQVIFAGIGSNPVSIIDMARSKGPGGDHFPVSFEHGKYIV